MLNTESRLFILQAYHRVADRIELIESVAEFIIGSWRQNLTRQKKHARKGFPLPHFRAKPVSIIARLCR
jgi:hypothetical protein